MDVCSEYLLSRRTFHLTVAMYDRYLLRDTRIKEKDLQLLAAACLYIASKYEEIYSPGVKIFKRATDDAYTVGEILDFEIKVLTLLNYSLTLTTHYDYMSILMTEWDSFATSNTSSSLTIPLFRSMDIQSYLFFNECMAVLDICRMVETH